MSLNMYLEKETYVKQWNFKPLEETYEVIVTKGGKVVDSIKPARIKTVVEEIGYWCKANAIHKWFVDNVQDGVDNCQRVYVDSEKLQELLNLVNEVLADHKRAPDLLPCQGGFFFGSTNYDEWYFDGLEKTKQILTTAIAENGYGTDIYYQSSW